MPLKETILIMDVALRTASDPVLNGAAAPPRPCPSAPRRRPWHKALLQLIRRVHLYAGLLMLPWALLYGITGFLFNHPGAFSDQTKIPFGAAEVQDTPLANFPSPAEVARQAVAAINAKGKSDYRLVQPEEARFEQGFVATVRGADGEQYTVVMERGNAGGYAMLRPKRMDKGPATPSAPFAGTVRLEQPLVRPLEQGLPAVLEKVGVAGAAVTNVLAFRPCRSRWKATENSGG